MQIFRAAGLAALLLALIVFSARAGDVTLTSRDGSLEITGTLLGFDGEFYRVDTEFGVLTVDGSGVNCDGPACPTLGSYVAKFTLSGAPEMADELIPRLIEAFSLHAGYALTREPLQAVGALYKLYDKEGGREAARITVRLTSSAEGFADLLGEQADMVLSLREATSVERELVRDAGLGELDSIRQFRVIARDALVPIVAPGNPVRRVTMAELAQIFAGKISRWDQLGGENAPITVHLTEPHTGVGAFFSARVLKPESEKLSDHAVIHSTVAGLTGAVISDPFGIGISTLSHVGRAEILTLAGKCAYHVEPTQNTVKAGDYPLTMPLYLYLPGRRLPKLAGEFLAFLRSDPAQRVVEKAGFVNQSLAEIALSKQGQRLANAIRAAEGEEGLKDLKRMTELLDGKARLSMTFRFRAGSALLDAPSRANAARLAATLESGEFDGGEIVFVGFSDGLGEAATNRRLSVQRAAAVKAAVLAETEVFDPSRVSMKVDGFGEALPMACDDTNWGRQVNRRVEIWVSAP